MGGYSLSGTVASGTVTPVNTFHLPLTWNNFEQRNIADVAPTVLSSNFNYDAPIQSIDVQFSEDVSDTFGLLNLQNLTTATPFSDFTYSYDLGTNIGHFNPKLPNRAFPDGNYNGYIYNFSFQDKFGNPLN